MKRAAKIALIVVAAHHAFFLERVVACSRVKDKDPWPGLPVSLKSASSSGRVAKVVTDASGHFDFKGIASGFYALHVMRVMVLKGHAFKACRKGIRRFEALAAEVER